MERQRIKIAEGDTLHDTLENRLLDIEDQIAEGVYATPRDGGDTRFISERSPNGLRGERYAVVDA